MTLFLSLVAFACGAVVGRYLPARVTRWRQNRRRRRYRPTVLTPFNPGPDAGSDRSAL